VSVEPRQNVVLCEGFDDRSFWKGWLLHLGCSDPTEGGRKQVQDVRGRIVTGKGRYLFRTPTGSDVIVQPFRGRNNARQAVEEYLGDRQPVRPGRVILNLDADEEAEPSSSAEDQIRGIAEALGGIRREQGAYEIRGSLLYPVIWRCEDGEPTPGLPEKQTLERLAASAIRAAEPLRGEGVQTWLDGEPVGLALPRSYSYSYFAKWYSNHGEGHFYECLWQDEVVVRELQRQLEPTGAWQYVDELVHD
jgi:hypothetical protein